MITLKRKVLKVHFHFICLDLLSEYIFLCTDTEVALANSIQRYLMENNRQEINYMQKNSPVFPLFQKGIDAKMTNQKFGFFYSYFHETWFSMFYKMSL
jgi:hypothetical protein